MRHCYRGLWWSTIAALVAVLLVVPHANAVPLLDGLGGPAGFGPGELPAGASSARVDLAPAFPDGLWFFGPRRGLPARSSLSRGDDAPAGRRGAR
jgi:hypothetical protein